jgi:hypothetical protein
MTTVVHCKKAKYDVLIDRTTIFGNPYPVGKHTKEGIVTRWTRKESIELFKGYFYYRMCTDKYFCFKVEKELKDKTLGCWCKPKACHGDIIAAYLDGTNDAEW